MDDLIKVSADGKSVTTASDKDLTFSTKYPFHKLDSLNPVSFQNIVIFFNADPPNPSFGDPPITTEVYQFAHGYKYVPSTWFMLQFDSTLNPSQAPGYNYEKGVIQVSSALADANTAVFEAYVDEINVTFYITKNANNGSDPPAFIGGYFLTIRSYVFVNDLLGGDVPTHA